MWVAYLVVTRDEMVECVDVGDSRESFAVIVDNVVYEHVDVFLWSGSTKEKVRWKRSWAYPSNELEKLEAGRVQ